MHVEVVLVATLFRLATAMPVLRWPLAGAILAIVADLADLAVINVIDLDFMDHYQEWDKYVDLAYFATFFVVARRWGAAAERIALALLAYRLLGVVVMESTGNREVLLLFPNVFEFWFVAIAAVLHRRPAFRLTMDRGWAIALAVLPAKLLQEWFLHSNRWLDSFTVGEFFDEVASWVS